MYKSIPKGIKFALVAAFVSGLSFFINKFAVEIISPPLLFTAVKNTGVGLILLPFLFFNGKWSKIKKIRKTDFIYLILIGIIGGSLPFYLFFTGLNVIPAINGALIHKTLVFWIILLAIPFLKEKLTKTQALAIILLFCGNIFIGGFKGFLFSRGEYLVLAATIFWAIENILAKKILPRVDPDIVIGARMIFGSIILLSASFILMPNTLTKAVSLNPTQFFWILLTMILLFAYVSFWYRALKYASVITVSAVLVSSTLVTNFFSAIFVTNSLTTNIFIQSLLVLSGVMVLLKTTKKQATNKQIALR